MLVNDGTLDDSIAGVRMWVGKCAHAPWSGQMLGKGDLHQLKIELKLGASPSSSYLSRGKVGGPAS